MSESRMADSKKEAAMSVSITPALKVETRRVALGSAICLAVMWIIFLIVHVAIPKSVQFNYKVILGGLGGCAVAVLNFFLMGRTVEKIAGETEKKKAYTSMQLSQRLRFLLMFAWVAAALLLPCFDKIASIIPLLFPSTVIKLYYFTVGRNELLKKPQGSNDSPGKDSDDGN